MFTIANTKQWLEEPFQPISLAELDVKAAKLERLDNKYVVRANALAEALPALMDRFDILEIEGQRRFVYDTCYFDDEERRSFFDHHQGRRQRIKVRVRHYRGTDLCFVEVKLKDKRGATVKKRLPYTLDQYGVLDEHALSYIEQCHQELYQRNFARQLQPSLSMSYRRVTLVAREGSERMTIDSDFCFQHELQQCTLPPDIFILETKSSNGHGISDRILRQFHQHPSNRCSKYCMGLIMTRQVTLYNNFRSTLRKLNLPEAGRIASHPMPLILPTSPAIIYNDLEGVAW